MSSIAEIIAKANPPHVATILDPKNGGVAEELDMSLPLDLQDVIDGVAELNRLGISLPTRIEAGVSRTDGRTKISNALTDGWIVSSEYKDDIDPPPIPYKSDSWVLGEFIVRILDPNGRSIPKKFLRSQKLLDKYIAETEFLPKEILPELLVLDPEQRAPVSKFETPVQNRPKGDDGCTIF